jgi:DNA-binding NtrC family response regulator
MTRILILDDDRAVLNTLQVQFAQTRRFDVTVLDDSTKALATIAAGRFDLLLLDMDMPKVTGMDVLRHVRRHHPSLEVVVITGVDDVELAVEAMKLGAYDYLCKPVDAERLFTCLDRALERSQMRGELQQLREKVGEQTSRFKQAFQGFVTEDADLKRTLGEVERIALSSNNVLICGESGTGKELVARAVHQISPRASKRSSPSTPRPSPHPGRRAVLRPREGAFTGAETARAGCSRRPTAARCSWTRSARWTVGAVQLLRVLQSGSTSAWARTSSATPTCGWSPPPTRTWTRRSRPAASGATCTTGSPPAPSTSRRCASGRETSRCSPASSSTAVQGQRQADPLHLRGGEEALEAYDYPGNLRELENVIASAAVLETSETLTLQSLPAHLRKPPQEPVVPYEVRKTRGSSRPSTSARSSSTPTATAAPRRASGHLPHRLLGKLKRLGIDVEPEGRGGAPSRRSLSGDARRAACLKRQGADVTDSRIASARAGDSFAGSGLIS